MPALAHVDLDILNYALTTTPGTTAGTSGTLVSGADYLVIASGQARAATIGPLATADLLVGPSGSRVVYSRSVSPSAGFTPSPSLAHVGNASLAPLGAAFTYVPGAAEALELQADVASGAGAGQWHSYAIELTGIIDEADDPGNGLRYHQEGANSDTSISTPVAAGTIVDGYTFTPNNAGDHLVIVSFEAFDGGLVGGNEIVVELEVDSVAVSGSGVAADAPAGLVYGYCYAFVVNLTAASHTIDIVADGTLSGGNIDYRRARFHVIEATAFESSDVQEDTAASYAISTGVSEVTGLSVTYGTASSADYFIFGCGQKQVSNWSESFLYLDSTTAVPTNGFGNAVATVGLSATDDMPHERGITIDAGVSAARTVEYQINKIGGGTNNYGAVGGGRATAGDIRLVVVRLETPSGTAHAAAGTVAAVGSLVGQFGIAHFSEGLVSGAGSLLRGGEQASGTISAAGSLTGTASIAAAAFGTVAAVGSLLGNAVLGSEGLPVAPWRVGVRELPLYEVDINVD